MTNCSLLLNIHRNVHYALCTHAFLHGSLLHYRLAVVLMSTNLHQSDTHTLDPQMVLLHTAMDPFPEIFPAVIELKKCMGMRDVRACVFSPLRCCSKPITFAANSIIRQDDNNQSRIERSLPTQTHMHSHTHTHTHNHTNPYGTISPQFIGSRLLESGVEFDQKIPTLFQEQRAGYITTRKSLPPTSCQHK